jgi:HTH-type transcriptional regulator/antitoxin HigA
VPVSSIKFSYVKMYLTSLHGSCILGSMSTPDLFDGHRTPGEVLRLLLEERGWNQEELATITGRSRQMIIQIMGGKAGITPEMAVVLGAAFGNSATDWLRLEANYRLSSIVKGETNAVERRAQIYSKLPVKDMQRRGWIKPNADLDELESEIKRFLRVQSLDEQPLLLVVPRRSADGFDDLTPAQLAWCARARQLAETLQVGKFDAAKLEKLQCEVRQLAAYPKEARHLPVVLARYGIRFVVVEPLPSGKLDGVAFWLDPGSPVIAVSVRFDRIDNFWHTIFHEVSHIRHGDALVVDTDVLPGRSRLPIDPVEDRANYEAAAALVPPDELESLVRRLSPLYSAERIVQFANMVRMHPGIIIGQLQHRDEVGYQALRRFLVKIREIVTETTLTDGWGHTVPSLT